MIVSRLFGGAGNQMFQYAAGRALADRLGTDLVLDTRYMRLWGDERGLFLPHYAHARHVEPVALPPSKFDGWLRYGLWRRFGRAPRFHREREPGFNPAFLDLPDNTYLHGYWQSERYFAPIADRIRADLRLTTPLDDANRAMAQRIAEAPVSVSVHVRRGDYLGSGGFVACPPAYYHAAIAHLRAALAGRITAFVFSNDPDWARAHLDLGVETVVVDINDEASGHFDMHLQSLCDHNIIANSTFSWWGAWLNDNAEKRVIAPRQWFAHDRPANPDICPPGWIRL